MSCAIFLLRTTTAVPSIMIGTLFVYPMLPAIPGLLFVGTGLLMLIHRAMWPIVGRLLYALPRENLKFLKAILGWCGSALVALAFLPVTDWWRALRARFGI
jgi:hypothetical protein